MTKQPQDRKAGRPGKVNKRPATKSVRLTTNFDLSDEIAELVKERDILQIRLRTASNTVLTDKYDDIKTKLEGLYKRLEEDSTLYTFRAIGAKSYEKLVDDNPVLDSDKPRIERQGADPDAFPWSPTTFPIALIAESVVLEDVDADFVVTWLQGPEWSQGELDTLFQTATEVNTGRRIANLGKG